MVSRFTVKQKFFTCKLIDLSKRKFTSSYIYPTAASGSLMTLSDIIAQVCVEKQDEIDWLRTLRIAAFGYLIAGPINSIRFPLLDHLVKDKSWKSAVKKMVIDQSFVPPVFNALFFTFIGAAKNYSLEEIQESLNQSWLEVTLNSYKVFPLTVTIAYMTLPANHRTVFLSSVAVAWNTYLSHVSAKRELEGANEDVHG